MSPGAAPPTQCVGPDYRSESQKPTATVSKDVEFENVHVLNQTAQLIALLTCVVPLPPFLAAVAQHSQMGP